MLTTGVMSDTKGASQISQTSRPSLHTSIIDAPQAMYTTRTAVQSYHMRQ